VHVLGHPFLIVAREFATPSSQEQQQQQQQQQ